MRSAGQKTIATSRTPHWSVPAGVTGFMRQICRSNAGSESPPTKISLVNGYCLLTLLWQISSLSQKQAQRHAAPTPGDDMPHLKSPLCATVLVAAPIAQLACLGTAAAQSSVTIYGSLDAYVANQSATGSASRRVLNSGFNPNALGFAGSEDLNGGLKAGFVLETQPAVDTGGVGQGGKFWGRQSLVYLSGDFGRVSLGRIHTAGRSFGIKYSATGWLTTDPFGNLAIAAGSAFAPVMNIDTVGSRTSNAVLYNSPRLGGFNFSAMQSAGEGGSFGAGSAKLTQLSAAYAQGGFSTDLVYNRIPAIAGSQLAQTDWAIGAQWALPGVRVLGAYFQRQGAAVAAPGATTAVAGSEGTDRIYVAGVSVPLGAHTLG
ncbi:hypothetical protein DBR42_29025, partial [Pelomonas sp. HMWF004]